jgi:RNA polymerase sigma factor (sigma-70 family)
MSKSNRISAAPVYFTTTRTGGVMNTPINPLPSYARTTPASTDATRLLTHSEVARVVCSALLAQGFAKQDLQDGLQDVYVKALTSFQRTPPPPDLDRMKALCAMIARNHAIDLLRSAEKNARDLVGRCDADEYTRLEYGAEQRDPVDAGRQLEVLAQLFREGRMPQDGVDILEGVASRCTQEEIAQDLGITVDAVDRRMRTMRKAFRLRMARLGMLPDMQPLLAILSAPGAIPALREAA